MCKNILGHNLLIGGHELNRGWMSCSCEAAPSVNWSSLKQWDYAVGLEEGSGLISQSRRKQFFKKNFKTKMIDSASFHEIKLSLKFF